MRVLLLSDIHANIDALEAVLDAAPSYDAVWNLGDVVGYGATPNEVVDRVRGLGKVFVRGNHDRACSGLTNAENFNPVALSAVRWTQRTLTEENTDWLRRIPRGPIMPDGPQVSCVHGSLLDEDQYVLSMHDAWQQLVQPQTRLTFFGHTHVQGGFAANSEGDWFELKPAYSSDDDAEFYELDLRESARYLLNPGSVGQPRDRDWRAAFAIYDDAAQRITFGRVPYQVRVAQIRIQRAGLPEILATRLRSGR
ncbi:MAG TPA: metallophosphoesterase family protein [Acidobacteriaceae bacterium]|jgi:diadenosine tetraphosphatase ApaH/serine/threonine PP2A family protein phosphatase|nr:metallophosphoesterase family protein [Acidobacteriaceae bacterium]